VINKFSVVLCLLVVVFLEGGEGTHLQSFSVVEVQMVTAKNYTKIDERKKAHRESIFSSRDSLSLTLTGISRGLVIRRFRVHDLKVASMSYYVL